ncbi:MAG: PmoA family protein [Planctomycetales bacterium]|nr:PmoA family protein [Planctomycetales bacterium]
MSSSPFTVVPLLALTIAVAPAAEADELPPTCESSAPGVVTFRFGNVVAARFIYQDDAISRPYFVDLKAPNGVQATRRYPPVAGQDLDDHPTFHPGLWMAFGDIDGSDYWRNKAHVEFDSFVSPPQVADGAGQFTARFRYLSQAEPRRIVCREDARIACRRVGAGYLLLWDSTFSGDAPFAFGDQEEMGLGFRMATPLRSEPRERGAIPPGTGTMHDAAGREGAAQIWGHSADWCDYRGVIENDVVGVTLMCHPQNFRPSWFHARDYGLLVANPFGRHAMKQGDLSRVEVASGERLRLRYGVWVYSAEADAKVDVDATYAAYLRLSGDQEQAE